MTTIRAALVAAKARIAQVSDSASGDAHALLALTLGVDRAHLLAHPERNLTPAEAERYECLVARAAAGEPLPYIIGRRAFYDRDLRVTPDVLIPRPETELLLEQALAWARSQPSDLPISAADIGTGSGALAVTFAAHVPRARVYALDVSAAALAVARANAVDANVCDRVAFSQGDLLMPLLERGIHLDLVMANLPYIPSGDLERLPVSQYEPRIALDGGADGLTLIRRLLSDVRQVCAAGALILLEIEARQGAAVLALAAALQPCRAQVLPDYTGLDRIVRVELQ